MGLVGLRNILARVIGSWLLVFVPQLPKGISHDAAFTTLILPPFLFLGGPSLMEVAVRERVLSLFARHAYSKDLKYNSKLSTGGDVWLYCCCTSAEGWLGRVLLTCMIPQATSPMGQRPFTMFLFGQWTMDNGQWTMEDRASQAGQHVGARDEVSWWQRRSC